MSLDDDRFSSGRTYGDAGYESRKDQTRSETRSYGTYPTSTFGVRDWESAYSREWSTEFWRVPQPAPSQDSKKTTGR